MREDGAGGAFHSRRLETRRRHSLDYGVRFGGGRGGRGRRGGPADALLGEDVEGGTLQLRDAGRGMGSGSGGGAGAAVAAAPQPPLAATSRALPGRSVGARVGHDMVAVAPGDEARMDGVRTLVWGGGGGRDVTRDSTRARSRSCGGQLSTVDPCRR